MTKIDTRIQYRFDINAREYGLIIKALQLQGSVKSKELAKELVNRRDAFRDEMIRSFQASIETKED